MADRRRRRRGPRRGFDAKRGADDASGSSLCVCVTIETLQRRRHGSRVASSPRIPPVELRLFLGFSRLGNNPFFRARRADPPTPSPSPQQLNLKRLKAYKASLILFPRRTAKPKAGDSDAGELAMAKQFKGALMPITKEDKPLEMVKVTEEMKAFKAYNKLRVERMNVWQVGPRIKRAEEAVKKAEEEAKTAKMK